jgi:hypothetical protein
MGHTLASGGSRIAAKRCLNKLEMSAAFYVVAKKISVSVPF